MSSLATCAATAAFFAFTTREADADAGSPPPTARETLFDSVPAATSAELDGVWQSKQTQPNGTVEIALQCTSRRSSELRAASRTGATRRRSRAARSALESTARGAATVTPAMEALALEGRHRKLDRQRAAFTFELAIAHGTLTLAAADARLNTSFTKVGD